MLRVYMVAIATVTVVILLPFALVAALVGHVISALEGTDEWQRS